jgi:hypothetical protein
MTVTHEDAVATLHAMFDHVDPKAISRLLVELGTVLLYHLLPSIHHSNNCRILSLVGWFILGGHMENTVERLLRVPRPGAGTHAALPFSATVGGGSGGGGGAGSPASGGGGVPSPVAPSASVRPQSPDRNDGAFRLADDFLRPPSYFRAMVRRLVVLLLIHMDNSGLTHYYSDDDGGMAIRQMRAQHQEHQWLPINNAKSIMMLK